MKKKTQDIDYVRVSKEGLIPGVLFCLVLRWCVSLYSYSGQNTPPLYGDFEAQRHWQEITLHIPITKWYVNTTQNNLLYWGLDYPPLTAYHSFLMGLAAERLEPESVRLFASRGYETETHKMFMRWTVFICDIYFYISAVVCIAIFAERHQGKDKKRDVKNVFLRTDIFTIICLLYPGIILIDHGHFQYNVVSLGLFLWSFFCLISINNFVISSIFFVMALNYKQMELYHSLPIFFYLLRKCLSEPTVKSKIYQLLRISISVIVTFTIIWIPFLNKTENVFNVLTRLFPLNRGVFEDKVSNVWCVINVVVKLRTLFDNTQMAKICLISTLIAATPPCIDLFFRINKKKFILSMINVSLAFFLFSFQVHEKTILLCAIPVLIHLPHDPFACFWFLLVTNFSMLPLLLKDGLLLPFIALNLIYVAFYSLCLKVAEPNNGFFSMFDLCTVHRSVTGQNITINTCFTNSISLGFIASVIGMMILTGCSVLIKPPVNLPHLFPLLVSVFSCVHFALFYLHFSYAQFCIPNEVRKVKNS